jgi:hypothetical protein
MLTDLNNAFQSCLLETVEYIAIVGPYMGMRNSAAFRMSNREISPGTMYAGRSPTIFRMLFRV